MAKGPTVFMFSGQGGQYFQMGRELFVSQPVFRRTMLEMDTMVRDLCRISVVRLLYEEGHTKAEPFERLLLTNPAIFMVEYSLAEALIEHDVIPDYTLAVSLGSYAAATIAGCIRWQDALELVIKQARVVEDHCRRGGMIAILSDPALYKNEVLSGNSELAAINFSSSFVVSAPQEHLNLLQDHLSQQEVSYQALPVKFPFHSHWIDEAREPFSVYLEGLEHKPARVPIICCAESRALTELPKHYFWHVARDCIRFSQTLTAWDDSGPYRYIDLGPAGTLATSLKYALPPGSSSQISATMTPFGDSLRNFESVLGSRI